MCIHVPLLLEEMHVCYHRSLLCMMVSHNYFIKSRHPMLIMIMSTPTMMTRTDIMITLASVVVGKNIVDWTLNYNRVIIIESTCTVSY